MSRLALLLIACAHRASATELKPIPRPPQPPSSLRIVASCVPGKPFTVAGEYGALFGRQNGVFEAWQWPVKILSHFRISAELADYGVPIDVNALAAGIQVTPAETVITYSHAAFTVRQHMFASRGSQATPPAGTFAYFEIESTRPLQLTFSFTPEMLHMWPAPNYGRPDGEWVSEGESGVYVLHTDKDDFSAVVAMPRTRPGIMAPYQERPQTYPLELKLSFDPKRDGGMVFPLLMAVADGKTPNAQAGAIAAAFPQLYAQTQSYYQRFFQNHLVAETPDAKLDEALQWAEVSIDQAQVRHQEETGLVAGYYESADSARPGYAWFFGRDSLFSTYAISSYGDFALTRKVFDFLIQRQRADGKIMHEVSQAADMVDWKATNYFYAAADSTPLFIMAMRDYIQISGDLEYVEAKWDAIRKAYEFTRAHDSDGDGIYDNAEGTGWVEGWTPGAMPHQEIYLAAIDAQSAYAFSQLAGMLGDKDLASRAAKRASEIRSKIESAYFEPSSQFYAFSRNADGSLDHTATIYPAVAWWDGTLALRQPGPMLTRWASEEFSTDWGLRDISGHTSFYDPISYHQGSVWPLFTGWVSLAEYRAGRPLSGYAHLMQNANLTWFQDLGSVTELLSGEFFQALGRGSSHQTWSSAMVITPLLRGLFGLDWDVPNRTLRVTPHLPAEWKEAHLRNVPFGSTTIDMEYRRAGKNLIVKATAKIPESLCLTKGDASPSACKKSAPAVVHTLTIPLRAVEIGIPSGLPEAGAHTAQLKVLDEQYSENQAVFTLAAPGGARYELPVVMNRPKVGVKGGSLQAGKLRVQFPQGDGYQRATVTFVW